MNKILYSLISATTIISAWIAPSSASAHSTDSLTVYDINYVDHRPEFPGGDRELRRFINATRRDLVDPITRDSGQHSRVVCGFVVLPDGKITHANVLVSANEVLDREALRIISEMPLWNAGRIGDHNVAVYCVLPIAFKP